MKILNLLLTLACIATLSPVKAATLDTAAEMWHVWEKPLDSDNDPFTYFESDEALYLIWANIWPFDHPVDWQTAPSPYTFNCDTCIDAAILDAIFYVNIPVYTEFLTVWHEDAEILALSGQPFFDAVAERNQMNDDIEASNLQLFIDWLADPYATPDFLINGMGLLRLKAREVCVGLEDPVAALQVRKAIQARKKVNPALPLEMWAEALTAPGLDAATCETKLLDWMLHTFFPALISGKVDLDLVQENAYRASQGLPPLALPAPWQRGEHWPMLEPTPAPKPLPTKPIPNPLP